jgi:dimeric dUTPase (all-alpha-NTP-PPase superfamily)
MTLQDMLDAQRRLQTEYMTGDPAEMRGEERADFFRTMYVALSAELAEAGQEIAWKPWSSDKTYFDRQAYLEELVDAWHFFMNLMLIANISADEFVLAYDTKRKVNEQRQLDKYNASAGKGGGQGGKL